MKRWPIVSVIATVFLANGMVNASITVTSQSNWASAEITNTGGLTWDPAVSYSEHSGLAPWINSYAGVWSPPGGYDLGFAFNVTSISGSSLVYQDLWAHVRAGSQLGPVFGATIAGSCTTAFTVGIDDMRYKPVAFTSWLVGTTGGESSLLNVATGQSTSISGSLYLQPGSYELCTTFYCQISSTDRDQEFIAGVCNTIPEPTTLIIWSLLGALTITAGWWRRRKVA
jgi:hypothetical protein